MKKILIIGAGAMGSAFAVPCVDNKNDVTIVGTHLENDLIEKIKSNDQIHPALITKLSSEVKFEKFEKLQTILNQDLDIIVCGVSSIGIEWFVKQISKKPILLNDLKLIIQAIIEEKNEFKKIQNKALILIGFAGGFRRSELVSIEYDDVDFADL